MWAMASTGLLQADDDGDNGKHTVSSIGYYAFADKHEILSLPLKP